MLRPSSVTQRLGCPHHPTEHLLRAMHRALPELLQANPVGASNLRRRTGGGGLSRISGLWCLLCAITANPGRDLGSAACVRAGTGTCESNRPCRATAPGRCLCPATAQGAASVALLRAIQPRLPQPVPRGAQLACGVLWAGARTTHCGPRNSAVCVCGTDGRTDSCCLPAPPPGSC